LERIPVNDSDYVDLRSDRYEVCSETDSVKAEVKTGYDLSNGFEDGVSGNFTRWSDSARKSGSCKNADNGGRVGNLGEGFGIGRILFLQGCKESCFNRVTRSS